ncbi:MAG: ATP-binding cassette domain-containing protein [Clostridia bacterium]|nr:ATP-binding cassette domain-containing protein [Clostridia bacterium]
MYNLSRAVILFCIASAYMDGSLANIGMFATMWMAADKLDDYLYDIFDISKSVDLLGSYAERIRNFFTLKSDIEIENTEIISPEKNEPFSLEFRNVSFRYRTEDSYVLKDLNFTVNKGEKVALVGENGVGKSTIVKLILRLYDVSEGAIFINGRDIREYDIRALRSCIGVAFQDTNMYAMSFRDNMELFHSADDDRSSEIISALKLDRILEKNKATLD